MSSGRTTSPPGTGAAGRPARADARRNRGRLLDAAGALFAEHGPDAALEQVAARAGVGVGALYRHFPTRGDLIEAVYRAEVDAVCHDADGLLAAHPPDGAMELWLDRALDWFETKRRLGATLLGLFDERAGLFAETSGTGARTVERLVAAARAAGRIRPDGDAAEIGYALLGACAAPSSPHWRARSRRLVAILMDGLRAGPRGAAPPPEPTPAS